ncbi:LDH2 family malate/lactate/ureidoglycolate dehydrogenase [Sphingomonas endophytica]|uniref:LDH2 family malate/lactate/ureidoglycolate dehydrogenase n=1 Tax=Sphingomonas endophytica TaxID=869719 RepID=A0A7X0JCI3_9SPHN|nr:Ldh family oxidoreductase [Sphingomonas endophytica]MBB6504087.1 LDH2 family malate/lactate/ureidoglycolate dehydrogenase [Sphingomonas endophytica]
MSDVQVRMTLDAVRDYARATLTRVGLAPAHVAAVAETIVAGERDGCGAHGLYRLLVAAHSVATGVVVPDAVPVLEQRASGVVRVDGKGGFAQLAFETGRAALVAAARANGIAALAINDVVHFAALWPEVEALVEDGLVALAVTPNHAWVAPAGGTQPVFGTNPIAFGWPRKDKPPFVFDFATSAVARGEIELHRRAGKPVPADWGHAPDGSDTNDAAAVLAGAMRTFGGHKGSALALMVELLAGPLIGDLTSAESIAWDAGRKGSPLGGELIIALDPAGFLGAAAAEHLARAETVFAAIEGQGARVPGARRHALRPVSTRDGVLVSRKLLDDIDEVTKEKA